MKLDVARTKLNETLVRYYARQIVSGTIAAGDALPSEPAIASQFGVSKPIVRETIQVLASLGMVMVQHGKRTVALADKNWDVLDLRVQHAFQLEARGNELNNQLYEARAILEMNAAGLAAKRATEVDITELQSLVDDMSTVASTTQDLDAFLQIDRAFHERVAEASGNRVLRQVIRDVHGFLASAWSTATVAVDELSLLVEMHSRIAAAIAEGNIEGAETAVEFHLRRAAEKDAARGSHDARPRRSSGAGRNRTELSPKAKNPVPELSGTRSDRPQTTGSSKHFRSREELLVEIPKLWDPFNA